jgi:hypothetical protein
VVWLTLLLGLMAADESPPKPPAARLQVEASEPQQELDAPEDESRAELAKVRRIYVDVLTGGESAQQIRDMIMTSLHLSKQFIITEEEGRADAVLKGAGSDEVFTDVFNSSESLNAHTQVGNSNDTSSQRYTSNRSSHSAGMGIGENESRHTEERQHEAIATVRLVNKNGDLIWSTTQESKGAKFLGASADVADKIAKRLATDYRIAKNLKPQTVSPAH